MTPLTIADVVECPHGGKVILSAANNKFRAYDIPIMTINDLMGCPISGCKRPLMEKGRPPCSVMVSTSGTAARRARRDGQPVSLVEKLPTALTDQGFPVQEVTGNPIAKDRYRFD